MVYLIAALIVLLLDQGTKWLIRMNLEIGEAIPVIGDFFQITSHRNKGAAFGILQGQRFFFILMTMAVVVFILIYLRKAVNERRSLLAWGLGLLLGGAIGNFIDRARWGEVVDFLQFHFRFPFFGRDVDYIFPIFNVADSAICVGVGLIILEALLDWRKEKKEKAHERQESESRGV